LAWRPERVVLSCEHATAAIPPRYAPRFARARGVLATHRAFDPGALMLARALSRRLHAPLVVAHASRLLVDANRSEHHAACFSRYTLPLAAEEREQLLERYHRRHRNAVRAELEAALRGGGRVLHVSVHSFTPVLRGVVRRADVGLLYDPARTREKQLARCWAAGLRARDPALRVRANYPYRGTADGLTTTLRRELPAAAYLGLELEVSQRWITRPSRRTASRIDALAEALDALVARRPALSGP